MRLPFDSRSRRFRDPFGAQPLGSTVHFTFPVPRSVRTLGVTFVVRDYHTEAVERLPMRFARVQGDDNVFVLGYVAPCAGTFFYRFEVRTDSGVLFVGRDPDGVAVTGDWLPEWQLTVYQNDAKQLTDAWQGSVVYHVFLDRFCRGGPPRTPQHGVLKDWSQDVTVADPDGVYRANDFYGGDLQGVLSRIPYLKRLGVDAVYLSPMFRSSSNHRYDTGDYMALDPLLGEERDFTRLAEELHKNGMRLILDGVFNHTGADSLYFNKFGHYPTLGAYQSPQSPYFSWYTFRRYPDEYDCWWGVTVVPTVRRDAAGFQQLIAGQGGVLQKWTALGADAWRLDVADELSSPFLQAITGVCHALGALVVGEVWEDATTKVSYGEKRRYFQGKQLDGVMNYPFRQAILDYAKGGDALGCARAIMDLVECYPPAALGCSMTLVDSHDTVRVLNALADVPTPPTKEQRLTARITGEDYRRAARRARFAAALQYLLPGMPTLYYGDEAGMQGYEDPINRRPYRMEDPSAYEFYCRLGQIHRALRPQFATHDFEAHGQGCVLRLRIGQVQALFNAGDSAIAYSAPRLYAGIDPSAPAGTLPAMDFVVLEPAGCARGVEKK